MGTVNKPASKAEPTTDVPAKAWGGGHRGQTFFSFFSSHRGSVLFTMKQKFAESRSITISKGIREDLPFKPEPMYNACPFQVNQVLQEIGWD